MPIRILLAEDQALLRGALAALLRMEPDFEVVAECADGESAWVELQRHRPDVLVTDIEMPGPAWSWPRGCSARSSRCGW